MTDRILINGHRILLGFALLVLLSFALLVGVTKTATAAVPAGAKCYQIIGHPTVTGAMKTVDCNDPGASVIIDLFTSTAPPGSIPANPCFVFSGGENTIGGLPSLWECSKADAKVKETQDAGNPTGARPKCITLAVDNSSAEESSCTQGYIVDGKTFVPEVGKCYEIKSVDGGHTATAFDCKEFEARLKKAKEEADKIKDLKAKGGVVHAGQPTTCNVSKNYVIPTWYQYLPVGDNCAVKLDITNNPNQIWLIGLAIADMLLRIAGLITVFVIISGGYKYIVSQFDPEGTKKAKDTVLNGLIGLVIVSLATAIVNFIGNTLK